MNQCYRLGIDIGSTTVKVAVIDDNNKILFADYERHYANIQETLASLLKKCKGELGELSLRPNITGSGGLTLSGYLHIPFVQEVVAVELPVLGPALDVVGDHRPRLVGVGQLKLEHGLKERRVGRVLHDPF